MLLLISAALAAASPGLPTSATWSVAAAQPIVGGFRAVAVSDAGVKLAAAFAAKELGTGVKQIESAHHQSVAGSNYRIVLWTTNGERWQVTVYRDLQGAMRLTEREQLEVADIGPAEAD